MAEVVTTIKRFIGTAAERAAMTEADRNATNPGSTYFESDTGRLYVLDAGTPHTWREKLTNVAGDVQLTGSILANDIDNVDTPTAITALQDGDGKAVLRVVDAAPYIVSISRYTTPTHTEVNVTTASGALLAANTNRKYVLIINNSHTEIFIAFGVAAVANKGVLLLTKGSSYEMSAMAGNLYLGAINAIHAGTGNQEVLITEGV